MCGVSEAYESVCSIQRAECTVSTVHRLWHGLRMHREVRHRASLRLRGWTGPGSARRASSAPMRVWCFLLRRWDGRIHMQHAHAYPARALRRRGRNAGEDGHGIAVPAAPANLSDSTGAAHEVLSAHTPPVRHAAATTYHLSMRSSQIPLYALRAEFAGAKAAGPLRRQHHHFLFDRNPRSGSSGLTAELRVATNSL